MSISGLYATIMATFSYPLYAGGAASVVWMWLLSGGGALALALSIAEVSSAYPTSGLYSLPGPDGQAIKGRC
jgi:amino acid transporter